MRQFKVVFLSNKSGVYNFECEVIAENEAKAKIAARSELMAERLNPSHYKNPVVSIRRSNIQEVA